MTDDPSIPATATQTKLLVLVIVALCAITVTAVVVLAIVRPQNTSAVSVIIGLMTPIIMAVLAYALHSMQTSIDGRMTQLLQARAQKEHVTGLLQGLAVNPNTALQPTDLPPDVLKPEP